MTTLKIKIFGFLILLSLFISFSGIAQQNQFNSWSLELTTGIHIPISPNTNITKSEYIGFKQFQLSARYMFTEKFGLKGHYAFNRFSSGKNSDMGISFNRVGLEGVANVGKLLKVDYHLREYLGLLFHTGFGLTFAQPSLVSQTDHLGNVLVGFTGEVKLNNNFTLLGDLTYVSSFKQQYTYSGELLNANLDSVTGSFVNVSIGIMYVLGERNKYHADWY